MHSRRDFIKGMCSTAVTALTSTLYPGLVFANAPTDKRLIVVILRGGMDGISALVPYGDKNYQAIRQNLALEPGSLLRIDPFFGLHPSLRPLAKMYKDGAMIAVPATASPYRDRSHFDAQNVLELGSEEPNGLQDGWLNRLVGVMNAQDNLGMAFAQGLPTILRGDNAVNSWAPSGLPAASDDYFSLVSKIYKNDTHFAENFDKALDIQVMGMDVLQGNMRKMARKSRSPQGFLTMAEAAGQWLAKPNGPRIASLELGGWDTHVQQGAEGGRIANNLSLLARGLAQLQKNLGAEWSKTVVVTITEFGRTVRPNGANGTDHGTAGTTFLMGGALKGGRIIHQWPGLSDSDLYQGRDLRPTIDIRTMIKGVLAEHYGLAHNVLNHTIFPGSENSGTITNIINS